MRKQTVAVGDVDDRLRDQGFRPLAPEQVARQGGGRHGKYLLVCGKGDEPIQLSVSTDLRNESGLGAGTNVTIWQKADSLAIVVGRGTLKLIKSGHGVRLACPLLLQAVGATVGAKWPAEFKDGVIFCVIPGAPERLAHAAAETRRAQAESAKK